jgi:membrane-associated HD superfamily phosphohydrolase
VRIIIRDTLNLNPIGMKVQVRVVTWRGGSVDPACYPDLNTILVFLFLIVFFLYAPGTRQILWKRQHLKIWTIVSVYLLSLVSWIIWDYLFSSLLLPPNLLLLGVCKPISLIGFELNRYILDYFVWFFGLKFSVQLKF